MSGNRIVAAAVCMLVLVVGQAPPSGAATTPPSQCSTEDFNSDPWLGPRDLPTLGSVGLEMRTYDRLGGLTPEQFIATFWDPAALGGQGGWRFPAENGFFIGPTGQPVHTTMTLRAGQRVDGGPIAPAFGQPGMGLQYLLVAALAPGGPAQINVRWLIENGFLARCVLVVSRPYAC